MCIHDLPVEITAAIIGAVIGAIISGGFLLFVWSGQRRQQFETTFFNLLQSLREMVYNTSGEIGEIPLIDKKTYANKSELIEKEGTSYYKYANKELQYYIGQHLRKIVFEEPLNDSMTNEQKLVEIKRHVVDAYHDFFSKHTSNLANYFRFSFNIISFVHFDENLSVKEKRKYINIIQAQMSSDELSLLFFNGIGRHGDKYFDFIEEYNLLQNIDTNVMEDLEIYSKFYPKSVGFFRFENPSKRSIDEFISDLNEKFKKTN